MDFAVDHRFSAPPPAVIDAMVDPSFIVTLTAVTDVGSVEVIGRGEAGSHRWLSARLSYDGSLDPIAATILGSDRPTWVQTYRLDHADGSGRLDIDIDRHGSLLRCSAEIQLVEALDDAGQPATNRSLRGDLKVRVPLLGGKAERALLPPILARIDAEARLLDAWLGR